MPTINISPRVRFVLYLVGLVGAVVVQYAIDKTWFGEAEMRLWSGIAAVLFTLAAAKTNLSDAPVVLEGKVEQTGPGTADVTMVVPTESTPPPNEHGHGSSTLLFYATTLPVLFVLVLLALIGAAQ